MKKEFKLDAIKKSKWIEALKSGKYEQGEGSLISAHDDYIKYCCLGVACKIGIAKRNKSGKDDDFNEFCSENFMPMEIQEVLAVKNDSGISFKIIASWIKKNL